MEKDFKGSFLNRAFTGLAIIIPFFGLIYTANIYLTTIVIAVIASLMLVEWTQLSKKRNYLTDSLFISVFVIIFLFNDINLLNVIVYISAFLWILLSSVLFFNKLDLLRFMDFNNTFLKLLLIFGFISSLLILLRIDEYGHFLVFILVFNTALVDIFAYLIGSRYGKNPLLKNISPNKTWEGFFGGILSSAVFVFILFYFYELDNIMILILFTSSIFAFVGDYSVSYLKRKSNIKDTGKILPGHGGILDRLDSHMSAATVFTFLYLILKVSSF